MPRRVIAISHYADPAFSPHMRRQAQTLLQYNIETWAIGLENPNQKKHKKLPYLWTDTFPVSSLFRSGPLSFLYFFVRTFLVLWKHKPDILQPIDAPALIPSWIHSVLRGIPLYYVSLEDLPHLTSLNNRPIKKAIWTTLENFCIKRARSVAVVARIDALSLEKRCKIKLPFVIRNVPDLEPLKAPKELLLRKKFGWTNQEKVLMYHGIIEEGRGIELVFPYLKEHDDTRFAIAGFGSWVDHLKVLAKSEGVSNQIGWIGPFVHKDLALWAQDADVGIVLIENISQGFYQALPCKLFEYVHNIVPVVASNFPEMDTYVKSSKVGINVDPADIKSINSAIDLLLRNSEFYKKCVKFCEEERLRTNWETESLEYAKFLDLVN